MSWRRLLVVGCRLPAAGCWFVSADETKRIEGASERTRGTREERREEMR